MQIVDTRLGEIYGVNEYIIRIAQREAATIKVIYGNDDIKILDIAPRHMAGLPIREADGRRSL